MAHSIHGRHRAPGRHHPVAELSTIVSRAGVTSAKATVVLAASGGLVAAFALPASAAPEAATAKTVTSAKSAPAAAPAAPAISAPAVATTVKPAAVGVTGVTVVAKPKPKPAPKPVVAKKDTREGARVAAGERSSQRSTTTKASRSTTRTSVATSSARQSSSQVVNIARGLLGIAYVYGGTTPAGFDCSGLTQYVYRKAGISLPRTASAQQRVGTRVSNPQPGDLVFYGSPAYHVGIFTGGDMMIDSPRTGKSTSERNMFGTPTGFGRF